MTVCKDDGKNGRKYKCAIFYHDHSLTVAPKEKMSDGNDAGPPTCNSRLRHQGWPNCKPWTNKSGGSCIVSSRSAMSTCSTERSSFNSTRMLDGEMPEVN